MRIIFMGTPEFAVPALTALHDAGHEIACVYTQPPRPAGRGKQLRPSPVALEAERLGVPNSSLSFHLTQLQRAGLIAVERQGRSLFYRADFAAMDRLVAFLMENCCADESCAAPTQSQGEQA